MIHANNNDRAIFESVARELREHADRMHSHAASGFLTDTAEIIEASLGQGQEGQQAA